MVTFADGSDAACLIDDGAAVWIAYDASKDDLWLVNQAGGAAFWANLGTKSLSTPANLAELEAAVRSLL